MNKQQLASRLWGSAHRAMSGAFYARSTASAGAAATWFATPSAAGLWPPRHSSPTDPTNTLDLGLPKAIQVSAALAGYWLARWQVECSPDAHLQHPACRIWLANSPVLTQVDSAAFAPGAAIKDAQ